MKAIQYVGANQVEVRDVEIPEVLDGCGLIKVSHAGICGTDLNIYAGTHPRAKAPLTMGHEFSGEMAGDYGDFKKGDRVTVYPLISCGKCTACKEGNGHVCNTLGLYGIDTEGGMGEYVSIPLENIIKVPDGVSDSLAAFIEPMAVAVHTLRERNYKAGDKAIVFGAGTIGLCMALTLKKFGATCIHIVETDETRIALAEKLGLTVINPIKTDVLKYTEEVTCGDGFDFVFDCAGVKAVADVLLNVVKVRGHIVVVASYKKPVELPLFYGMAKETSIEFVRVYRKVDFEIAAEMAQTSKEFEQVITHVLDYNEAQKGFDLLLTKGTGAVKVMFKF